MTGRVEVGQAADASFEFRGIPREVAVHDDAGDLEVEADSAGIGAEEEAAVRIVMKGADFLAAVLLGDAAGAPCVAGAGFSAHSLTFRNIPSHSGEDDDFHVGIGEGVFQDAGQFLHFRAVLAVAVFDDGGRVADHAHHGEQDHEAFALFLFEGALGGLGHEAGDGEFDFLVVLAHGGGEFHEVVHIGALG